MLKRYLARCRYLAVDLLHGSAFSVPHVSSVEQLVQATWRGATCARALDLGCGKTPKNPFGARELHGVDVDYGVSAEARIVSCDLGIEPLPYEDASFDVVSAFDLIEHIPRLIYVGSERRYPFIQLMNEIYRVLKPGGLFLSCTPAWPRGSTFVDPTHVNVITTQTFSMYFCTPHVWASRYGFVGSFVLCQQAWCGETLVSILRKN